MPQDVECSPLMRAATLIANALVLMASEIAPAFEQALTMRSSLSPESVLPQIKVELCVLYLHLYRRSAFLELGTYRSWFLDQLRIQTAEQLSPPTCHEGFLTLCSELEAEYSRWREVPTDPEGGPGGTLFWEFGKRLGFKYQGYNPIGLQLFILQAMNGYIALKRVMAMSKSPFTVRSEGSDD